ncbi:MAG TPA: polysaccharide deacetylase family protein [Nitrolancea sp.]|nr:polysaccharide deacetylase family protein [Nitrolancea sp.]
MARRRLRNPLIRPFVHRTLLLLTMLLVIPIGGLLAPTPAASAATAADVRTIRQFQTTQPVIVLTFDAGADRGFAGSILDTLASKGVKASFGMTGVWASQNADLIQRMAREGHHLINHTWDHKSFTGTSTNQPPLTPAQRADELKRTEDLIRSQTGVELKPYFRPPYGDYDNSVLADIAANGYTLNILWTVDTLGWNGLTAAEITQRVLNGAAPGAIMLMHVGAQSQDGPALAGIIDQLRARGYRFATVRDLVTGAVPAETRYFPETGHWLSHGFLGYWERFGGLPIFGYPLTEEFQENGVTVQYFERARFEWHPGSWPERYDVLLGLLGNTATAGRSGEAPFRPTSAKSNCDFYAPTGHNLCGGFRGYWNAFGGLPIFGYPISEEFAERNPDDGQVYTVQYFERARFEWHPGSWPERYDVLLGRLGADELARGR